MKVLKAIAIALAVFCVILYSCLFYDMSCAKKAEATPKIIFSKRNLDDENPEKIMMTVDEFLKEDIEYDIYRNNFHYSKLSEDEQFLYRCVEYALENGYPNIYVDDALISGEEDFDKPLRFLALDSPLLEHNIEYAEGTFRDSYKVGIRGVAAIDGFSLKIDNINDKVWNSKLQALDKAKKIVENMPKHLNEAEKAKYLFSYTVENVEYLEYEKYDGNITVLYDGLIGNKTNCDGSVNMYSLLLNIAGVENYEKWHRGEGEESGHAWNMVKIDGAWYNVDATSPATKKKFNIERFQKRYFAFEDDMQKYIPSYNEIYPEAKKSLEEGVFAHIKEIEAKKVADMIVEEFSQNEDKYVLLLIDDYSETAAKAAAQRLANLVNKTVYRAAYDVHEGRKLLAFYL